MKTTNILRRPFRYAYGNAILVLVGLNVFVFFLMYAVRGTFSLLALRPLLVGRGWVWQFASYLFVHGDFQHLFFNMLGLLVFGIRIERDWGTKEFLLFYFATGILVGALTVLVSLVAGIDIVLYGASGAVFAILLAFAVSYPDSVVFIFGVLPVPAPVLVLVYTLMELGSMVFGQGGSLSHLAHLFGFLVAFVYFFIRFGVNPINRLLQRR